VVEGKRVAVVVPALEEELLVADTIRGIPAFVDMIVVVDDHSRDATAERARATRDPRLEVIEHAENQGVGGAIATGYARCRDLAVDVTCVMAADNQMDPSELASLVGPVARGEVDYAKANRLVSGEAWKLIPRARYLGNAVLSTPRGILGASTLAEWDQCHHPRRAIGRMTRCTSCPRFG